MNIPQYLIIHHAGGTDASPLQDSSNYTVAMCDADHKARGFTKSSMGYYVGYQYVIEKDGKVTQCRKDDEEGCHTIGKNNSSIGIMLCGNFDATLPTPEQIYSLRKLLVEKMTQWKILPNFIVPHRQFASKTCYGNKLADSWARDLVKNEPVANPLKPYTTMQLITELTRRVSEKDI